MLNRDAGSDALGDDEEDVCVQSVWERVQMAGEYNNNSRNFANENKLGKKMVIVVTLRSGQKLQLTRCHRTSYIVPLTFDKSYNFATCQYLPSLSVRQATMPGRVLPSAL